MSLFSPSARSWNLRHWWIRLQIVESARTGGAWHLDAALSPTQRADLVRIGCCLDSLEQITNATWSIVDGFTAAARHRARRGGHPFPEAACDAACQQLTRHAPRPDPGRPDNQFHSTASPD